MLLLNLKNPVGNRVESITFTKLNRVLSIVVFDNSPIQKKDLISILFRGE